MADYQVTIDDLLLGAGTSYELASDPDGLGLPDVRSSDTERPQDHGLFWGADFLGGRKVVLELLLLAPDAAGVTRLMDELTKRWQPPEGLAGIKTLTLELPGRGPRVLYGRPRRLAYDAELLPSGAVRATAEFEASDPRFYEALQQMLTTGLPVVSGGRSYPRTYPMTYGAAGVSGSILAVNSGNYPSRPVATITGPVTNPRIELVTTGEVLSFTYALGAGSTLVVDFDAHTVLEGGTSSRYYALDPGSTWWDLNPGLNEVRFQAQAYDPNARLELRYRSSWL